VSAEDDYRVRGVNCKKKTTLAGVRSPMRRNRACFSFWQSISDRHFPQLELLQFGAAFRSAAGDVADATLLYGVASARLLVMVR
jgi:hypothetical protein